MRKCSAVLLVFACLTLAGRAGAEGLSASAPKEKPAFDADLLFTAGQKLLAAGDVNGARAVLTRALIERTDFADAYAVRAVAEIRMGNRALAESDIHMAHDDHANDSLIQAALTEIDHAPRSQQAPQDAWATLQKHALAGEPFEKLVPFASAVVKATNAVRTRWDETYQSHLAALEKNLRDHPAQPAATLDLADYLYAESQPLGEPLSPKGGMRYYRFSDGTMSREIYHADALYDRVLRNDPQNVRALTGKAAIRLEHDDWQEGVAYAKKALATGQPTPQLLELLSRILADNAASNAYTAQDLRTPKSWMTFGIGVTIMWTRQPSDAERQRAANLSAVADELFAQADAQLEAAAKARAGTADAAYYQGLLAEHHRDPETAMIRFQTAVRLDSTSERNRRKLAGAYLAEGRTQDAVEQQEALTLMHETTDRFRLAAAWNAIDKSDLPGARAALDAAAKIDPADSRIPAYLAAVATAENKPAESLAWCQAALALEEANDLERGVSLTPMTAPKIVPTTQPAKPDAGPAPEPAIPHPLNGDQAAMAVLLNIRSSNRYAQLKEPDKQLAALQWNAAIEARLSPQALHSTPPRAVLPNPGEPGAAALRTVANLVAWSHVLYGHSLLQHEKVLDAYQIFADVGNLKHARDIYEPQGLCFAGEQRIKMAGSPGKMEDRKVWLGNAFMLQVLTQAEVAFIMQGKRARSQLGRTGYADQRETMQLGQDQMDLSYFQDAAPVQPGAYDPRNNPNYHGTGDAPPDAAQYFAPAGPGPDVGQTPQPRPQPGGRTSPAPFEKNFR